MDVINNVILNGQDNNLNNGNNNGFGNTPNGGGKKNGSKIAIIILSIAAVILSAVAVFLVVLMNSSERKVKKELDLGQQYIEDMDYEEAIACFERAIEIEPLSVEAYMGMADAYLGLEDYDSAVEILEDGIKVFEKAAKKEKDKEKARELDDSIEDMEDMLSEVSEIKSEIEEAERLASLPYFEVTPITDCANDVWGRRWDEWSKEDFVTVMNTTDVNGDGNKYYSPDSKYMVDMSEYGDYLCEFQKDSVSNESIGGKYINIMNEYSQNVDMFPADYYYQQIVSNPEKDWQVYKNGVYYFAQENGMTGEAGVLDYCNLSLDMFNGVSEIEVNTEFGVGSATLEYRKSTIELIIYIPETETEGIPDMVCFRWDYEDDDNSCYVSIGLGNYY